jgi:putative hemolysin
MRTATSGDAPLVACFITALTMEICHECDGHSQFRSNEVLTPDLCAKWIDDGVYMALIAYAGEKAVGVVTIAESYALYAGGKIESFRNAACLS